MSKQFNNPYECNTPQYNSYRYLCKNYPDKSYDVIKKIVDDRNYNYQNHYGSHAKRGDNTIGKPAYKDLEYPYTRPKWYYRYR